MNAASESAASPATISVDRCDIIANDTGIIAGFSQQQAVASIIRVANSKIAMNSKGITTLSDGAVYSRATAANGDVYMNTLADNYKDGAFTANYVAR